MTLRGLENPYSGLILSPCLWNTTIQDTEQPYLNSSQLWLSSNLSVADRVAVLNPLDRLFENPGIWNSCTS